MQKQNLVYKIGKIIVPNDPESSIISIHVIAKEGENDIISFQWGYNSRTPNIWTDIKVSLLIQTCNLTYLLNEVEETVLQKYQPEKVLEILEKNHIQHATGIRVPLPGQQEETTFYITKSEKDTGAIQINGQTYQISAELAAELKILDEQHPVPPPAFQ